MVAAASCEVSLRPVMGARSHAGTAERQWPFAKVGHFYEPQTYHYGNTSHVTLAGGPQATYTNAASALAVGG